MADKYILRVSAGPTYDESTHIEVPVNCPQPLKIHSRFADIDLNVRVKNFRGLPYTSLPDSNYFLNEPHASDQDQYSIAFRFTPLAPQACAPSQDRQKPARLDQRAEKRGDASVEANGISGADLQFGNDFDHPIRDRLPPGFNTALSIVRWWIDPGLDGDAYADKPYLYGPALSSFNVIHVGPGRLDHQKGGLWFEEGGDEAGRALRTSIGAPAESKARRKWALREGSKQKWVYHYGQPYCFDFFNPYLDFTNFALKLPGFSLPIMKYWDGQVLRYVLRNKTTNEVYLVIVFALFLKEDVNDDGSLKDRAHFEAAPNADVFQPKLQGHNCDAEDSKADEQPPARSSADVVTSLEDVD